MAKRRNQLSVPKRRINLVTQNLHIKRQFANFAFHSQRGHAAWTGSLQPRITSPSYIVEIQYSLQRIPQVWVLSPPLAPNAVHLYQEKNLCLYWPKEWKWQPDQLIATTIIPWAASWLHFYELWLDTGKWLGPSSHDFPLKNGDK